MRKEKLEIVSRGDVLLKMYPDLSKKIKGYNSKVKYLPKELRKLLTY